VAVAVVSASRFAAWCELRTRRTSWALEPRMPVRNSQFDDVTVQRNPLRRVTPA
jgi:hypothetical protein